MSLVIKKVTYTITLRFAAFEVDVTKEISESDLRQFHGEIRRLESAVADQLGTFAAVTASAPAHETSETMAKILAYAQGKKLFKTCDVEADLQFSSSVAYAALKRLAEEKKLTRLRLAKNAWGYTLPKQESGAPLIDATESEESRMLREDLKRLGAAENQARIDSR